MWNVVITLANGHVDEVRHDTRESARHAARWYRQYTELGNPWSVVATRVEKVDA